MRSDHHGAVTKQLTLDEELAERGNARVVKAAAWLVEDQNVRCCRKGHNKREAASLAI
jgi:hypothetical protein